MEHLKKVWRGESPTILFDGKIIFWQRLWMVALFSVWLGFDYHNSRPYHVCNLGFVKIMWIGRTEPRSPVKGKQGNDESSEPSSI